jgi:hypothetical protein
VKILDMSVKAGKGGAFRFYGIGDLHLDLKTSDHDKIKQYVKQIASDKNAVAFAVGDYMDGTTPEHKFFDPDTIRGDVLDNMNQYTNYMLEMAERFLLPIVKAGVPLVLQEGNHDIRAGHKYVGFVSMLAGVLRRSTGSSEVYYAGQEALTRLKVEVGGRNQVLGVYSAHGAGGGGKPGGKINKHLDTVTHIADADIYLRGHVEEGDIRITYRAGIPRTGHASLRYRPMAHYTAAGFATRRVESVEGYAARASMPSIDDGVQWLEVLLDAHGGQAKMRRHEL